MSATYLVRQGMMWEGLRLGVGLAVAGEGVGVVRGAGDPTSSAGSQRRGGAQRVRGPGGGGNSVRCYGCGNYGHVKSACPTNGLRCYGCGMIGHLSYGCPGLSLPRVDANRRPVAHAGGIGGSGVSALNRPGSASVGGAGHPVERRKAPLGARANV